jgi:hypothetical protein
MPQHRAKGGATRPISETPPAALCHDAPVFMTRRSRLTSKIRDILALRPSAGRMWELGEFVNVLEDWQNNAR